MYVNGSSFLAVNCQTGTIDYSATSATTTIQNVVNQITANGGTAIFQAGTWPLGSSGISISGTSSNWEIGFLPGTSWTYSGSGYALSISAATRGSIKNFDIVRPYIVVSSNTGGGISINGGYLFTITEPYIQSQAVAIDLDNLNTAKIIGGGYISNPSNPQAIGSVGIRLAKTGYTNNLDISLNQVSGYERGIQLGSNTFAVDVEQLDVHDTYFSSNKVAIQIYTVKNLMVRQDYFENQASASVNVTNTGSMCPSFVDISNNVFIENPGVNNINIPNGNYLFNLRAVHNNWAGGNLVLGNLVTGGIVETNGITGSVTISSPSVRRIWTNPDPEAGQVTGISTGSLGLRTATVTYPRAYPSGVTPIVQLTLQSPTDSNSRFGGIWASAVTNTGFTINIAITTSGVAGSTVSCTWIATSY